MLGKLCAFSFLLFLIWSCSTSKSVGVEILAQTQPAFFNRQLDSVTIRDFVADTFWVSLGSSLTQNLTTSIGTNSGSFWLIRKFKRL